MQSSDGVGVVTGGTIETGDGTARTAAAKGQIVHRRSEGHEAAGTTPVRLLASDEPPPFEILGPAGSSPFLIICDHAGRLLPRSLGDLGLSPRELDRHIAWDIGACEVASRLGAALDAVVIRQRYSRLVIDCNRRVGADDSIVTTSERTLIPGNQGLTPAEAERRAREIFHPYHDQIVAELDRRARVGQATILIAMHSFTPLFLEVARQWHAGVLYIRDGRHAEPLLRLLRAEPGLVVGCNEPYQADELTDYSIVEHGERRGIPYVELEIRQDLIADAAGQAEWAARLARLLPIAADALSS